MRAAAAAVLWAPLLAGALFAAQPASENTAAGEIRQMNVGKAQLENGDYKHAITTFRAVLASSPDNGIAQRNLARALLFDEEFGAALAVLDSAATDRAHVASTEYLAGLVHLRLKDPASALPKLENAARLDPSTAAIRFQLAKTYEALGRIDDAAAQYRETVRLDPQHAGAHFELAMFARNHRDLATYREELRQYIRLRDAFGDPETSPLLLEACRHTHAEPPEISGSALPDAGSASAPVRFVDATASAVPDAESANIAAIAVLDVDADGRYVFFALGRDDTARLLSAAPDGTLRRIGQPIHVGAVGARPLVRVGNFHDTIASADRLRPDLKRYSGVLVIGESGARLFERRDATGFVDVTEPSGLSSLRGRDARWVDYEYDGDLDLVVAGESGIALWQNGGDGRFTEVATAAGLHQSGAVTSIAAADLDDNGGVDLVLGGATSATPVYMNQRAGRFLRLPNPPGPWPAARQVLVDDIDNDGAPDAALVGSDCTVIRSGRSGLLSEWKIDHPGFAVTAASLADVDNDGWLDFVAAGFSGGETGQARLRVWRNDHARGWREVTKSTGLGDVARTEIRDILPVDFNGDGATDLLLTTAADRLIVLRNEGTPTHRQIKLRLESLALQNHGGIGARIEIRSRTTVLRRFVTQQLPIEIGVGSLKQIDSVQVVWTDGTVDNKIDAHPGETLAVNRVSPISTGSCPYLYACDGTRFRFVTDFLGSGALGLALTRDATWPPDPVELVRIGDNAGFRPRNGRYAIVVSSELREVDYFDSLKLVAVDHAPDVEVHPTDSFMAPPVTPSELWAAADPLPLVSAVDSAGRDVTAALQRIDGTYAESGEVLAPPLRGVCRPITYTLDFGPIPTGEPLVLAVTGLLEFGTASSNIALSQTRSAGLVWPTLEAETADHGWQRVAVNIGIPDGRTKTNVCDLAGKLPAGTRRLRLTTSFQIYWDRIAMLRRRTLPASRMHEQAFTFADLQWRGFSAQRVADGGRSTEPVFDRVSARPPWSVTVQGWCTRYGDVRELASANDGKIAVLNGGDAMTLECPADALPPVPPGLTRTFFLAVTGWDKEENANTVGGDTVDPLPGQPPATEASVEAARDDWTRRFNTRWVSRHQFDAGQSGAPPPSQRPSDATGPSS